MRGRRYAPYTTAHIAGREEDNQHSLAHPRQRRGAGVVGANGLGDALCVVDRSTYPFFLAPARLSPLRAKRLMRQA
jgi:hypothetical protein